MAGSTKLEVEVIKRVLTEPGSFDPTGSGLTSDNVQDAIVEVKMAMGGMNDHDDVTLDSGDTTQETLTLTGQEITVNLATTTTDGVMSVADKLKLDGIEAGAEVNPTFKTIDSQSIIGVGNISTAGSPQVNANWDAVSGVEEILNKPTIPSALSDLTGDLSDITGDMDDIADGATYVKTENNFSDADKTKLDTIEALNPSSYYDSITTTTITNGADGWSTHYTNSITEGVYHISLNLLTNSSAPVYVGINLGTVTKRGPIQLTFDSSPTVTNKTASYADIFVVESGDTLTFNLMKKGNSANFSSINIVKLA